MEQQEWNIDLSLLNSIQKQKMIDIFGSQHHDNFCKLIWDKNIGAEDEVDYSDTNITEDQVKNLTEDSDEYLYLCDISEYLKNKYPFIVTVPEEHWDKVLSEGNMIPVEPSDEPWKFWFKGTLWIDPFLETDTKRYIIALKPHVTQKVAPFLANKYFKWVWFLPFPAHETLKKDRDYDILWFYSGKEFKNIMLESETKDIQEKVRNIL